MTLMSLAFLSNTRARATKVCERHPSDEKSQESKDCFVGVKPRKSAFSSELVVGKVWRVRHRKTGQIFAMKVLENPTIIMRKSVSSVMNEIRFLSHLRHPFLINAHYAFQDISSLYLGLDTSTEETCATTLPNKGNFWKNRFAFFVCCILLGLEYLHSKRMIHRDLKP